MKPMQTSKRSQSHRHLQSVGKKAQESMPRDAALASQTLQGPFPGPPLSRRGARGVKEDADFVVDFEWLSK